MPQEIKNCPLCNRETKTNMIISKLGRFGSIMDMMQCQNCQLFYHREYYTKEELSRYYGNFYSESMTRTVYEAIPEAKMDKSRLVKKSWTSANKLYDILSYIKKDDRILDIGSGGGGTGRYLKENGCIVEFIEPNKQFANMLKKEGHVVHESFFEDMKFSKYKKYDMIVMGDVIEHLLFPVQCVEKIYNLLVDGGRFYFSTPLAPDGIIAYREAQDAKQYTFQIPHFTIFNTVSITKLLENFSSIEFSKCKQIDNVMAIK